MFVLAGASMVLGFRGRVGEFGFWPGAKFASKFSARANPDVLTLFFSQVRKTSPLQSDKRFGALLGLANLDCVVQPLFLQHKLRNSPCRPKYLRFSMRDRIYWRTYLLLGGGGVLP